ncbi:alkaline phosphatase family protein [Streptomyces sp. NPDC054933]
MPDATRLNSIDHIVVLMQENRSFDHMLGFFYTHQGNRSASGQPFEGLTGTESNPNGTGGGQVTVFRIDPTTPGAYFIPGADPGEGYRATNRQLFGTLTLATPAPAATNDGFVADYRSGLTATGRTRRFQS